MAAKRGRVRYTGPGSDYRSVRIERLKPGTVIHAPIYEERDGNSLLLLSAGTRITESLVERLAKRGVREVRVQTKDLARMRRSAPSRRARTTGLSVDELEQVPAGGTWGVKSNSFVHKVRKHGATPYDTTLVGQFRGKFQSTLSQTLNFFQQLNAGDRVHDEAVVAVAEQSVKQIAEDLELFVSLGIRPNTGEYPGQHSLQCSMLALSVGTTLGLTKDELLDLGTGCLLHDLGMLRIDSNIYNAPTVLDPIEFLEITKHPGHTFELIRPLEKLSTGARMVAYQMHERCDGSGYPRKRRRGQIHYLAKIAAVADVFVAMISPRPYRPPYVPYHAIEEIIRATRSHQFDPDVVRALLRTVSLFPIGSYVELSDHRVGKVIRANGEQFTRPVVEVWDPLEPSGGPEIVDLANQPELSILRPLSELPHRSAVTADAVDMWE